MIKNKKSGKTLDKIGKRWHDFDFKSERTIYCYLCCNRKRIRNKELQNLNDDLKFEEYQQWKQYICNKYQNYNTNKLTEFSRYLNLMIRNIKPSHEYWNIMAAALLSVLFATIFNFIIERHIDLSDKPIWIIFLVTVLLETFFVIFLIRIIIETMYPIYDNYFDENFLKDYKEIIDDILYEKMK